MGTQHLILGTAGHIDHGKSSLVHALTGTDPDRLKEEKLRGITIELGFANLDLGSGRVMSFVDVPGHERFVRHMVAGATGMDAVLLVVAADQGVQPQTREHLDICRLLGLREGLVVLSKRDLVDPELLDVVRLEVADLVSGTFLEQAPLVAVSARTAEGLNELRDVLVQLMDRHRPRPTEGVSRLPVDRSFVLRGFGTVVTGTLASGLLREGSEVQVLPGDKRGRIRGLEVHGQRQLTAVAGQRTAVNLQGLDCTEVPRGATVTTPGALLTTRRVWACLSLLPHAPRRLEKGGRVRFHQGTCEREASLRPLGRSEDGTLRVELYLDEDTVLAPGDRFILRRSAPVDTVGGGTIVDVRPPRARQATAAAFDPAALEPATALALRLDRSGAAGRDPLALAGELGLAQPQLEAAMRQLESSRTALRAGTRWMAAEVWSGLERSLLAALEAFHAEQPLRRGVSREELRSLVATDLAQDSWRELLEGLSRREELVLDGERVSRARHQVVLGAAERDLADRIETLYRDAGLDPPDLTAALRQLESSPAAGTLVSWLVDEGRLIRIQDGRLFHSAALQQLRDKLRDYRRRSPTIDVGSFKELAGVTRKNAIPLLEQLDAERTTRRVGNVREILAFRGPGD